MRAGRGRCPASRRRWENAGGPERPPHVRSDCRAGESVGACSTSPVKKSSSPVSPVQDRIWSMVAAICRTAEMLPSRASRVSVSRTPSSGRCTGPEPGGDVAPGLLGLGRHQVEDRPDLLRLAADHADPGRGDVRLVELDLQAEPLQHRLLRGVLPLVARSRGVQVGDGLADVRDLIRHAARRVVAPARGRAPRRPGRSPSPDTARRTRPRRRRRWRRPGDQTGHPRRPDSPSAQPCGSA